MKWRTLLICIAAIALPVLAVPAWMFLEMRAFHRAIETKWTEPQIAQSKADAAVILNAIQAYHVMHKTFPDALTRLPIDMSRVPPAAGDGRWQYYSPPGGAEYTLWFGVNNNYFFCEYSSDRPQWRVLDAF